MITTLTGKNNFELLRTKKKIVADFVLEHSDMALEQFDCSAVEPQVVYDALTNLPFLVSKKLVVLDEPSANKALAEKLPDWIAHADSIDVLIVEPAVDKRTVFYKFLQTKTKIKEFTPLRPYEVEAWIKNYAKEKSIVLSQPAIKLLIDRVGIDQQQLAKEIDKLALYKPKIEAEDVDVLIEDLPQNTVFEMLDSLVAGNTLKTMDLYEQLLKKRVDANEIIGMLGWQLHTLSLIRAAGGRESEIANRTKLHPFVIQKNFGLASRLSMSQLKECVDKVFRAELSIKRDGLNAENVVSVLLLTLSRELQ
jgi:DNA polymerase-3 subunit delta